MTDTNTTDPGIDGKTAANLAATGPTEPKTEGTTIDTADTLGLEPLTDTEIRDILADLTGDRDRVQDIWYKGQRVIRTTAQAAVGFIVAAPVITQIIDAIGLDPTTHMGGWLAAIGAGTTALAAVLSRVMTIPAVNRWLVTLGMGSVPRNAA